MGGTASPLARRASWFKPELRTKDYSRLGDAYDDAVYQALAEIWAVPQPANDKTHDDKRHDNDYLTLVKQASAGKWVDLRLLADFMQIGRIPRNWSDVTLLANREDRWGRANIRILDLVEDLSRNVIEALGTEFGITPDFFRAHIADYAWYNVRDRWREPQPLEVMRSKRHWFQIRYVTTRYFASNHTGSGASDCFESALEQAKDLNIFRRPDDDKSRGWWDSEDAVVALTRSRATFWLKPKDSNDKTTIGVLLLDPTVSQGLPLWRGHRNFHPVPSTLEELKGDMTEWQTFTYDKQRSFFEDFVYWAKHPQVSRSTCPGVGPPEHLPVQALLHLIGAEWLTMCDYIKTRLNQIDLETVDPVHFAEKGSVEVALDKLHVWRRFIPPYREMVSETLPNVFNIPCYADYLTQRGTRTNYILEDPARTPPDASGSVTAEPDRGHGNAAVLSSTSSMQPYENDFKIVLTYLEEYQERIDRLTSVVTAVMAVGDTRIAIDDGRNIGRLTWLATFFILFSVEVVRDEHGHYSRLFATTLPVAIVTVVWAWALHSPIVRGWLYKK